ncbi:MAG: hypothetical protein K2M55_00700 [Muribaculaceae bacterium]|nr:hypothetical protein [Muribaculaceae bacterium]
MKYSALLLTCLLAATSVGARTLLVGHRGCDTGVENTAPAYINGAARGYDFLECDVRITADGHFVICHDTDNRRLGGKHEIAEATLAELRADTLQQERLKGHFTGTICTLTEYLDICRDADVRPVIELKWSTGINSKDFTNIPALIDTITAAGFRDKCVILTSMKPCLQYIRETAPDIELQFLGNKNWQDSLPWCDSLRIDIDIAHDQLDSTSVAEAHAMGLKVNCWTVDKLDRARELQDMGVDIITTNAIMPEAIN